MVSAIGLTPDAETIFLNKRQYEISDYRCYPVIYIL